MAKYTVKNTSILHNGKLYKEGSTIELTDIQAKRLEDFVTVLPNQVPVKPKTETQTKTETKTQTTKNETKSVTLTIDGKTYAGTLTEK